ncbi:MAG TPA: hypothetical protein VK034_17300, partial [Enhygromyxa sp.]|nr:hypothetical protein [Enhygromyxa sp.]
IGPSAADEPTYMTPARVLARPSSTVFPPGPFFATAKQVGQRLTLDLGNSLPTALPGDPPDSSQLGALAIGWLDGANFRSITTIDYDSLIPERAGVVDIELGKDLATIIQTQRLCLANTSVSPAKQLLAENGDGYYMLADQFVYRMNPGIAETDAPARGDTATVNVYVTQFGQPLPNAAVTLTMLDEQDAIAYTSNTLGTSGTRGIANLSTPASALQFSATSTSDSRGVARFELQASDPGDPRGSVDGQVYFLRYQFQSPPSPYVQGPDELVSVQVYQQATAPQPVTWTNTIAEILGQYGMLYPIMSNIGLNDYDSVVRNHAMIKTVLSRSMLDPLHMPVTRDLSDSRRKLVLDWIDAGMPK